MATPAANLINLDGVSKAYGVRPLLDGVSLGLQRGDRVGIVGRNGDGKTTLLRLMADLEPVDEGRVTQNRGLHLGLLSQRDDLREHDTIGHVVLGELAEHEWAADVRSRAVVEHLLSGLDLDRRVEGLSGGERRRVSLAKLLLTDLDVLLLDEPTNHLDLEAIEWLEQWLARFRGAFIVISHDRTFLKRLTRSSLWLDRGTLRRAEIGFGGFEAWTDRVYDEEARAAEKLDAKLKLELHWLQRGVTARRRRNQGRLAKLGEMRARVIGCPLWIIGGLRSHAARPICRNLRPQMPGKSVDSRIFLQDWKE